VNLQPKKKGWINAMRRLDFDRIVYAARELHDRAQSAEVKRLAELVAKLSGECEELEKHTRDAYDAARRRG
jgi:hypothetical protein